MSSSNIFHVITRCTRPNNLKKIYESFGGYKKAKWTVMFDASVLAELDMEMLNLLTYLGADFRIFYGKPGSYMYPEVNKVISSNKDLWTTLIDDDNIIHPSYFEALEDHIRPGKDTTVFIYNQILENELIRLCSPEATVVGGIDLAQFTFHPRVLTLSKFTAGYCGDGEFIESLHKQIPEDFCFINEELSYYNYLTRADQQVKKNYNSFSVPKVWLASQSFSEDLVINSLPNLGYEDTSLKLVSSLSDDPDVIITLKNNDILYEDLCNQSLEIRRRWIELDDLDNIGEISYNVAMNAILDTYRPKVSYFTSAFNTKQKIHVAYNSLQAQTVYDWEWIIVNDSPNCAQTRNLLDQIAFYDKRVKVYEFKNKSGGIIGEAKYRAAMLCSGEILAELDHDDELDINCTDYLIQASTAHPEAGFFYTNCIETDENGQCMTYPDGFSFGYGKYETDGDLKIAIASPINPKTIRHIVGVPNHVRAWRRSFYHSIGGHNRRLSVADDYELIVRSFLNTEFCHINALGYDQKIYNNQSGQNTHNATRGDIQRRVRTIMYFYNELISKRFKEVGYNDWAYDSSKNNPLSVNSVFDGYNYSKEFTPVK